MENCKQHKWVFKEHGFLDEEVGSDEYELYFCYKCLAEGRVTFSEGKRILEITEVKKGGTA